MRKIKFRGKSVHYSDVWRYGNLIINEDGSNGITDGAKSYGYSILTSEVIPETVGQYTGLKDKNGVEIYEGDVMNWDSHWGWYVGYENGAFRRIPLNDIQRMNWRHHTLQQEGLDTWEIIGNIHDNPEHLEDV